MEKGFRIAVVAPALPEEFYDLLWEGVWSAAFELASFGVVVENFQTDDQGGVAQLELLQSFLKSDFSAIAIAPANSDALNDVIGQHWEERRPVVTFHSDAPGSRRCSFVGASPMEAGALAAETLVKFMRNTGKLAMFPGDCRFPQHAERFAGFERELERRGRGIETILGHEATRGGLDALDRILTAHPDLGGLYVGSSRTGLFAAELARRRIRIPFVGFDHTPEAYEYLQDGTVSALIDESVHQQGYIAVQRAYESCLSETPCEPLPWVRVHSSVVLATNSHQIPGTQTLNEAFEQLIRQQTAKLRSYQEMLEAANDKLVLLAETDSLTGLLNRRKFEELLPLAVANAALAGESVSLLLLDVDAFKDCNDTHGHHVGDEALRTVARVLQECLREGDSCARLGGDEFCVLLPGAGEAAALRVKDRIRHLLLENPVFAGNAALEMRVSVGIATYPRDADSSEELVIAADRSMYETKRLAKLSGERGA